MFEQTSLLNLFLIPQRNGLTKPKRLRGKGIKMVNMGELFSERRIKNLSMDKVPCSEKELLANKLEKNFKKNIEINNEKIEKINTFSNEIFKNLINEYNKYIK